MKRLLHVLLVLSMFSSFAIIAQDDNEPDADLDQPTTEVSQDMPATDTPVQMEEQAPAETAKVAPAVEKKAEAKKAVAKSKKKPAKKVVHAKAKTKKVKGKTKPKKS